MVSVRVGWVSKAILKGGAADCNYWMARETRVPCLERYLLKQGIVLYFMTRQEKQILARLVGNQKKLGGTTYFSEIIELRFGYILNVFRVIVAKLSLKMYCYPQFSSWSPKPLLKSAFPAYL